MTGLGFLSAGRAVPAVTVSPGDVTLSAPAMWTEAVGGGNIVFRGAEAVVSNYTHEA
ncbi:MAG: hypothetical protein JWN43_1221 [Gammaproteobacteria bacterium]|nr:hypothetical protein [Gammaproteobacteria bacterium]